MEWRRFEVINKNNEDKLVKLLNDKKICKEDLILILSTIRLINTEDEN